MKKFTKLTLTLAMLFGLVGGVTSVKAKKYYADLSGATAIGNATWTAGTNTFGWTAGSYAFMVVPGGSFSGDLSGYTTIGLTVADINQAFRVDIIANGKTFTGKSISTNGKIVLDILNDFNKQWEATKITIEDLKSVEAVRLNTNSSSGSAVVTDFYIAKPASLSFDDSGNAEVDFTDLIVTGGLSFDETTGVLTNDGNGGKLYINLPTDGVDFSNITTMTVNHSGDDVIDHLEIADSKNEISNGFWGSKYGVNFTSGDATKFNTATNVNKVEWTGNATEGSETITSIVFHANVITCTLPGTPVVLNTLQYHNMDGTNAVATWNIGTATDTYYGSGSSNATNYVDLTDYEELYIHRDNNTGFRAFFINAAGTGTNNINNGSTGVVSWNETEKCWVINLSKVEKYNGKVYLNTIKSTAYQTYDIVNNITVYKTPVNAPNYILAGKGTFTPAAVTALADENATYIDAIGITGATLLNSANPNCMITANAGMVTNTKNVIVSGTCASLELADGHPFKAPADFTATNTAYTGRSFTAAQATTVCLPFELTSVEAASLGKFYEYSSFDGSTLHFSQVAAPVANKPYFVIPEATSLTLSGADKIIVATPAALKVTANNVDFIGTMEATKIPASDGDYSYYAYNNGDFVKITTAAATLPAFRAYFKVLNSAISSSAPALNICFDEFETTGIKDVKNAAKSMNGYYNLNGQKVAQPTKGLYIVNGKKVVIK